MTKEQAKNQQNVAVAPDDWVLACVVKAHIGYSAEACRGKINQGVWPEHFSRKGPDGKLQYHLPSIREWMASGVKAA